MNFCPVCRKDVKETFCDEHRENELHYKDIVVRVCECKKYFRRNRWLPFNSLAKTTEKIAKDCIKEKVGIKSLVDEEIVKKPFELEVGFQGEKFIVPAKLQVERCPICSKMGTEYFESTMQLRPKRMDLLEFVRNQIEKDPHAFIANIDEKKEGFDLLLSSNKAALNIGKKLNKSFKGELKTSRKLFGFDKNRSKHLYRVTVFFRAE